jgi:tripeptide aminopeptidase
MNTKKLDTKRLVNTFCEFVKIPSESPEDKEFVAYMEDLLKKEGAKTQKDEFGNLLARFEAKNSDKTEPVLFCCHADTVKPGIGIEPVVDWDKGIIKSKGETILGADDKAGIAEVLEMIRTVDKRPPIEFLIVRCEEISPGGAENLDFGMIKSKMGYVLDMDTPEEVVIGGPSYLVINVKYKGKSAHAGMCPEQGISAIQTACLAISKLQLGRIDEGSTANVGIVKGGQNMNSIPENVEISAECRSLDHKKANSICQNMVKIFQDAATATGAKVDVEIFTSLEAYSIPEDSTVVKLAAKAVEKIGLKPDVKAIAGGTDATHLNHHGIQTAVLGIGAHQMHSTDEFALIDQMLASTKIISGIVEDLA